VTFAHVVRPAVSCALSAALVLGACDRRAVNFSQAPGSAESFAAYPRAKTLPDAATC
jgi:hypothetical protein